MPPVNRRCVEICAGNGREGLAAKLIINHGWSGYLFDGNEHSIEARRKFFKTCRETSFNPPVFTKAWITAENVNELIADSGVEGPIDLLSLDMDGTDSWIWKIINVVDPRAVVCDAHNIIPPDRALTVPCDPQFVCKSTDYPAHRWQPCANWAVRRVIV